MTMFFLNRTLFLATNIILLYIFLTPRRKPLFQVIVFLLTWLVIYFLRMLTKPLNMHPLVDSYLMGSLYIVPCILVFAETIQAKIFVFYMIYSLSQLVFLVFMYVDGFFSPALPQLFILVGMLLELVLLPLIGRYLKKPLREILDILNQHTPVLTTFPLLTFLLFVIYSLQKTEPLFEFIKLVISTVIIFISYIMISVAISRTRRRQELEHLSMTDDLTGLYNRRYFERRFQDEIIRYNRTGTAFALIAVDIDFFKNVNDRYGHDCGDFVLKAVSEGIRKSVRTYDVIVRWGGDEFFILLPETDGERAFGLAERIRKTVETGNYSFNSLFLKLSVTLGLSLARAGDTCETIIKKADIALYHGKNKNRNCTVVFDESMKE